MPKETKSNKARQSHKGKRHPAHAASFARIAKEIRLCLQRKPGYIAQPTFISGANLAKIFENESKRLRKIVR